MPNPTERSVGLIATIYGCVCVCVDGSSDFSLFEALRETIYSEVATLISQNESRPHFLIELFHELQLLNTDYLRQRALYSLQVRLNAVQPKYHGFRTPTKRLCDISKRHLDHSVSSGYRNQALD